MGPLALQGLARYLPLLGGGAAVASQTDPKGLEYLKEGLSSLINPASYSLNPLENILESKIEDDNKLINIPKEEKIPEKDPNEGPEIPPSGIGEALDLIKEREERRKSMYEDALQSTVGDPNVNYRETDKKRGQFVLDAPYANNFWSTGPYSFPGGSINPSKSLITYMKPGDFLKLSANKDFSEKAIEERDDRAFELYEKNKTGLTVPVLDMTEDAVSGDFEVIGHEGRSRAKYFENLDPNKLIPVQIQTDFVNTPSGKSRNPEYIDYTKGSYTHGQSIANLGEKLLKTNLFKNQDGDYVSGIEVLGYEGDGKKVEPKKTTENPLEDILESQIQNKEKETYFGTEEAKESFYDVSNNIDVMFDIKKLNDPENQKIEYGQSIPAHEFYENQYHGGVADLGNAAAFKKLKKLSYYPEYKKLIQEAAKEHLGETFPAYRLVRGDNAAAREGKPSLEKDINSYSLNPEDALRLHNLIDYNIDSGENRKNLLLQEVYINAKDLVMRGKEDENEIIVNTKKLDTDTVRVFDPSTGEMIKDATKGELVGKELFKFSDKTILSSYKKDK